jgi:CRISPR-associated protein (TIGR03986 family)
MPIDKIRAPFGFVPLSATIVKPDWAQVPAHDVPFADGVSGALDITLTAETPICVRSTDSTQGEAKPFKLGNQYAIPASTVRGAIRNLVTIASFGRMARVNDHRYGVRDLQNAGLYVRHMADIMPTADGTKLPMPKVCAGWLRRKNDGEGGNPATIELCDFAKIHYKDLIRLRDNFAPGRRQGAIDKYRSWGTPNAEEAGRRVEVWYESKRPAEFVDRQGRTTRFPTEFGLASTAGAGGGRRRHGTVVFTGQPNTWDPRATAAPRGRGAGNPKQHDFVFFDDIASKTSLDVSSEQLCDFEFVHADRGQQNRSVDESVANPEWSFWRSHHFRTGGRVPVFVLLDETGRLRSFGLAMMFRLAYRLTTRDAVRNAQPGRLDVALPDLSDLIFGTVGDTQTHKGAERAAVQARAGRASFTHFVSQSAALAPGEIRVVLGAPKASYYPEYIEQGSKDQFGARPADKDSYVTLMDPRARVRGWKRYRPLTSHVAQPQIPQGAQGRTLDTSRVETRIRPLAAGTVFRGSLRFHNLRPIELGAIVWALRLGNDPEARHTLGLGRPIGLGRAAFAVEVAHDSDRGIDLAAAVTAFESYMDDQLGGPGAFRASVQIQELLALARPIPPADARYMLLNHPENRNEFVEAKKAALALAPASRRQERANFESRAPVPGPRGSAQPAGQPQRGQAPTAASFHRSGPGVATQATQGRYSHSGSDRRAPSPPSSGAANVGSNPKSAWLAEIATLQMGNAANVVPRVLDKYANAPDLKELAQAMLKKLDRKSVKAKLGQPWVDRLWATAGEPT